MLKLKIGAASNIKIGRRRVKRFKFNVMVDGAWGSCGKGLITTALAHRYLPQAITTTNMPNAGHTARWHDGTPFIAKVLPSAAILHRWIDDYKPLIYVGPSAAFNLEQLFLEVDRCGLDEHLIIHERASVVTDEMKNAESGNGAGSTKHIASTMQGCGVALAAKIQRVEGLKLASDYEDLMPFMSQAFVKRMTRHTPIQAEPFSISVFWNEMLRNESMTLLHEGSQGFSLDINHGSHYPFCTSRSTTAAQALTDIGIAPQLLGDVYLVIRPYPIRVGNVYENGVRVGYSGGAYEGQSEITWEEIARRCGGPPSVFAGELTTVTKRLRRVFEFSCHQLFEATRINGATKIALNFANYLDWSCFGETEFRRLPSRVLRFIDQIEDVVELPVSIIGTGPNNNNVVFRD